MKNLRYAACLLCLFSSLTIFAQNKTWLGATFGFTNDDYQIESASDGFQESSLINPTAGLTVEQELGSRFSIVSGILYKNYLGAVEHVDVGLWSGHSMMNSLRIPFSLKGRLSLLKGNATLFALAGGNLMLNLDYARTGWQCTWCWIQQTPIPGLPSYFDNISEQYRSDLKKTFWLLEGAGGFEIRLLKSARLGFSVNHFFGFQKVVDVDFDYTDPDGVTHHADAYSKGNHWSATMHLHYPISRWWH